MKEDISPSMLAFDYGKLAIEINVGIVVVYNRKLLLIPNLLINSNKFGIKLTGETLLNLCEDIGEPCCNDGTIIGFTTLTERMCIFSLQSRNGNFRAVYFLCYNQNTYNPSCQYNRSLL